MKIHVFSNYTGMIEASFNPDYKTTVEICGDVKSGTLSIGSQNFKIDKGCAVVPLSAFKGEHISVSISAKVGGKVRHWPCGELKRELSGDYAPEPLDARGALILALRAVDELRAVVGSQADEIKKLSARAAKKLM